MLKDWDRGKDGRLRGHAQFGCRSCPWRNLVVRSRGMRRQREDKGETETSRQPKKRKLVPTKAFAGSRVFPTRPEYLSLSTLDDTVPIPSAFRTPSDTSRLQLSLIPSYSYPDREVISYKSVPIGPTGGDSDAASLRTVHPIPIGCGVHYYEAEVIDSGAQGFLSVGWMKASAELGRMVGWDRGSWGWHGDDGRSFEGQGSGEEFGEKWGSQSAVRLLGYTESCSWRCCRLRCRLHDG